MKKLSPSETVYLIDGSSFLYRSYYALTPLNAPNGMPVQAVYGFVRMIHKIIKDFSPEYCALVWDSAGTTARKEAYPAYKEGRSAPPSDIFAQKKYIERFAELIGLHQLSLTGEEADDLMAVLAHQLVKEGKTVVIISSDKDMRQIVSDHIFIFDPFRERLCDRDYFEEKYGFSIDKLPFYFALVGDSSDNIPGVKGVGPKTAEKLVKKCSDLDELYKLLEDHPEEVGTKRLQQLLHSSRDNAYLSQQLFTLRDPVISVGLQDLEMKKDAFWQAYPLFEELNFKSLLRQLPQEVRATSVAQVGFANKYGYSFTLVTTQQDLAQLSQRLAEVDAFAIDTETTLTDPMRATLVGIAICYEQKSSYYIPVGHTTGETQLSNELVKKYLNPILSTTKIKKYLHNAKFDHHVLMNAGFELAGISFDTLVAASLVKQDGDRIGLKELSQRYFNENMLTYKDMVVSAKLSNFSEVPIERALDYAAADALQTYRLVDILSKELDEQGMRELYLTIEHVLIGILYKMEHQGICVDGAVLDEVDLSITQKLAVVDDKINAFLPEGQLINLNSPSQVADLLFNQLHLPPVKKTKTGYSTDQEVLEKLAPQHEVARLLIEYRELFKLKSTYVDSLKASINKATGRIHTTYNQTAVSTGRLSSNDPNLQNIPANGVEGVVTIRSAFKPKPANLFISADYSQIELRILAQLSGDEAMTTSFLRGEDIHRRTAAKLFGSDMATVTHQQRQLAKRINFSILYGLTPYGLSRELHISMKEAKHYIETYMAQYPGVQKWMEDVVEETKEFGYITTIHGRRRYLPEIYEVRNQARYRFACRAAINTRAQGTAAEIMKMGMISFDQAIQNNHLDAAILLQIHDEILVTVGKEEVDKVQEHIKQSLEKVVDWQVPLQIDIRSGKTWEEVSK